MKYIDIAHLLTSAAGNHLSLAYQAKEVKQTVSEINELIQAVLLFQAAMESIINEEIHNHELLVHVRDEEQYLNTKFRSLSFKNKWRKSYEELHIKDAEYLELYLHFYTLYRVQITHPKSRSLPLKKYRYKKIYEGLQNGWYASQMLFAILGKELVSWEDFCTIHHIRTP